MRLHYWEGLQCSQPRGAVDNHRSRPHSLRDATRTFWPQIPTVRRGARGLGLRPEATLGLRLIPLKRGSRRLRAARWRLRQPPKRLDKREPQDGIGARLGHPRPSLRCPGQPRAAGAPPRPRSRQDQLTSTADGSGQLSGGASPRLSGMSLRPRVGCLWA